jgi:hypothetical protein
MPTYIKPPRPPLSESLRILTRIKWARFRLWMNGALVNRTVQTACAAAVIIGLLIAIATIDPWYGLVAFVAAFLGFGGADAILARRR